MMSAKLKIHLQVRRINDLESSKPRPWRNRLAPWVMAGSLAILPFAASGEIMDLSSLQLNGSASTLNTPEGVVLRLTPAEPDQAGSAFTKNQVNINGFSTSFTFQITNPSSSGAADGLVFVVQSQGLDYQGKKGYALGYWDGTYDRNSVGVEFDTWESGMWAGDNNDNHVALNTQGQLNGLAIARVEPSFQDGSIWYAWIDYNGSQLEIRTNQTDKRPDEPWLSYPINLQALLGGTQAFVGFTAATGGSFADYDILSWEWSSFLKEGLVAHYPFNGDTQDVSGNGNHGTVVKGAVNFETGVEGLAAHFNGSSSVMVENPKNIPFGTASRSIAVWVKMNSGMDSNVDQFLVGYGQSAANQMFALQYGIGDSYNYGIWLAGCENDLSCTGGQPNTIKSDFYHLVATYDKATNLLKLFVNGQEENKKQIVTSTPMTNLYMGGFQNSYPFFGLLDDLRIYNRVLSDSEIQSLYQQHQPLLKKEE